MTKSAGFLFLLLVGACTPTVAVPDPTTRVIPAGTEPEVLEWGFDRSAIERDLLLAARNRLGEATIRRALAAEGYIFAKFYPGMIPPPPAGAGPDWRPPEFPFALLFQEKGQWLAATRTGARPADPGAVAQIHALLADPAFWRQPQWAKPGCTDAGASLLMLKVAGRPETVRRGACGDTELNERLVSFALRA